MSATGIGASVKRKEDIRFITGKGHYVDDINRPGQAYAYFLRSPHAHATIDKIDASAALKSPGVVAVFTGADTVGRQDRRPYLRLDDPLEGRLADEGRRPSGACARQGALCRRSRRRRHRRHLCAGARTRPRRSSSTMACCRRSIDTASAAKPGQPQVHDVAPNNTVFNWHLGDKGATDAAFATAHHVTKLDFVNNRLIPNAMEPRAALGEYDSGTDTSNALHDQSEPASSHALVLSAFRRHCAGEQAAGDRA